MSPRSPLASATAPQSPRSPLASAMSPRSPLASAMSPTRSRPCGTSRPLPCGMSHTPHRAQAQRRHATRVGSGSHAPPRTTCTTRRPQPSFLSHTFRRRRLTGPMTSPRTPQVTHRTDRYHAPRHVTHHRKRIAARPATSSERSPLPHTSRSSSVASTSPRLFTFASWRGLRRVPRARIHHTP